MTPRPHQPEVRLLVERGGVSLVVGEESWSSGRAPDWRRLVELAGWLDGALWVGDEEGVLRGAAGLGTSLRLELLPGELAERLDAALDRPARLAVCVAEGLPELAWGCLLGPGGVPVALDPKVALLERRLGGAPAAPPAPATPPAADAPAGPRGVVVLLLLGAVGERSPIDVAAEEAVLAAAVATAGGARLEVEEFGTLARLASAVAALRPQVLHVAAHGERGVLLLEDEGGGERGVTGEELAGALGPEPPPLVVLSACESARGGPGQASAAEALLRAGAPAVLAMGSFVSDDFAVRFGGAVLRACLGGGLALPEAVAAARREVEATRRAAVGSDRGARRAERLAGWTCPRLLLGADAEGAPLPVVRPPSSTRPTTPPARSPAPARRAGARGDRRRLQAARPPVFAFGPPGYELEEAVDSCRPGGSADTTWRPARGPLEAWLAARGAAPSVHLALGRDPPPPGLSAWLPRLGERLWVSAYRAWELPGATRVELAGWSLAELRAVVHRSSPLAALSAYTREELVRDARGSLPWLRVVEAALAEGCAPEEARRRVAGEATSGAAVPGEPGPGGPAPGSPAALRAMLRDSLAPLRLPTRLDRVLTLASPDLHRWRAEAGASFAEVPARVRAALDELVDAGHLLAEGPRGADTRGWWPRAWGPRGTPEAHARAAVVGGRTHALLPSGSNPVVVPLLREAVHHQRSAGLPVPEAAWIELCQRLRAELLLAEADAVAEEGMAALPRRGHTWAGLAYERGLLAHREGRWADAEAWYLRSLELDRELADVPGESSTLGQLARLAQDRGDRAARDRWVGEAERLAEPGGPADEAGRAFLRGREALHAMDLEEAAEQLTLARRLLEDAGERGRLLDVAYALGELAEEQGMADVALREFEEAARGAHAAGSWPLAGEAAEAAGTLLHRQGRAELAALWFERAAEAWAALERPEGLATCAARLLFLAPALAGRLDVEAWVGRGRRAAELAPASARLWFNLGSGALVAGAAEAALDCLRRAATLDPPGSRGEATSRLRAAEALAAQDRWVEADRIAEEVAGSPHLDLAPHALLLRARVARELQDRRAAQRFAAAALPRFGEEDGQPRADAGLLLATLHEEAGELGEALEAGLAAVLRLQEGRYRLLPEGVRLLAACREADPEHFGARALAVLGDHGFHLLVDMLDGAHR